MKLSMELAAYAPFASSFDDAMFDARRRRSSSRKFRNAGQTLLSAPTRLYVQLSMVSTKSSRDKLAHRVKASKL
ncbi:hypothetical protein ACFSQT_32230 [Mesorhizobium calcicola]|uniref:Uncharacterized protein n=1 Tax=Mesorhizobium calcicola TaxID=1300310 RepID=A0ABW4WN23_9HYPH